MMEESKRKAKTVPLTRKEPLSQRTVPELFSGSGTTQQVKTSIPAVVEMETSVNKLPSAWASLLKEKPLINQEATVSAASSIEKVKYRSIYVKNKKAQCSKVPTEVQTDVGTQQATGVENVRAALEGAEEPENSDQGLKATSSD